MSDEKRIGELAVPDNITSYLNDAQQAELNTIERFGWSLKYIRRPVFQKTEVVVMSPDGTSIGILEDDGRLNLEADIQIR